MNVRPERFVHVVDIRKQARNASLERHCLGFYLGNIGNTRNRALSKMAVSGSTPRNQNGTSRSTPDRNTSELRRIVQTFQGPPVPPPSMQEATQHQYRIRELRIEKWEDQTEDARGDHQPNGVVATTTALDKNGP